MANTDSINKSSDIQSYVPSETQRLLKDLEKDLKTSTSTDTNFQRVRDQLKNLRLKYPDLVEDLDAIEVYLRSLEYQKTKEKNALLEASNKGFSELDPGRSRCVSLGRSRCVSPGEWSTAGNVGVSIPDTTNASVDAAGKTTQEHGSTIIHGDGYFDRADVRNKIKRGRELLADMPLENINAVKQNTGILQKVDEANKPVEEGV